MALTALTAVAMSVAWTGMAGLTGLAGAVASAAPPLAVVSATRAVGSVGSTARAASATSPQVGLVLRSLTPAALAPGDHLSVTVAIVNPTSTPLRGARVRLFVNSPLLTTRAELADWASGQGVQGGDRFAHVDGAEQPLASAVPARSTGSATITVRADQLQLGSSWGARGVTVDVLDSHLHRLDDVRTFLVWTPDGVPAPARA